MAMGIILVGVIQNIPFYTLVVGHILAITLFCVYGAILSFFILDFNKGTLSQNHTNNPINSFAIGTWVASTSVVLLNAHYYFPQLQLSSIVFFGLDFINWLWYLWFIVRNFIIFCKNKEYIAKLHGAILLSCVATQSLVIVAATIYSINIPRGLELGMVILGFVFYLIGIVFIMIAILKNTLHNTILNWANTNCIIHGALSITGLALCISMKNLGNWLIYFWLIDFILFCLVECIELIRIVLRVKSLGFNNGLFAYHPTQWARNFTFGMLVNFTIHLPKGLLFEHARLMVVEIGKYVVVILFVIEVFIFLKSTICKRVKPKILK
ncbi:SLAC1 family transporter [Rummeliibacillus sp. JY-2-4R]